jgi:hypothetical protein
MKRQKKRNTKSFKKQMKKVKNQPLITLQDPSTWKIGLINDFENEMKKLSGEKYVTNENVNYRSDLRYVVSLDNLPEEIKKDVKKLVTTKKPYRGQCMWYSKFISSQIKGVNQIFGLFQVNENQELGKYLPLNQVTSLFNTLLYKDENEKVWSLHSWNEYNGVHFDCLKNEIFEKEDEKEFIKYTILKKEVVNLKPQLSKLLNYDYEFISSSI